MSTATRIALPLFLVGLGACGEMAWSNFLSFNPRAMSSEGKGAVRCLADLPACVLPEWRTLGELETLPECKPCAHAGKKRYAVRTHVRPDGTRIAVAVGVDVYTGMIGDTWIGVGNDVVHCKDTTRVPSPLRRPFVSDAPILADDPRCSAIDAVPPPARTR